MEVLVVRQLVEVMVENLAELLLQVLVVVLLATHEQAHLMMMLMQRVQLAKMNSWTTPEQLVQVAVLLYH